MRAVAHGRPRLRISVNISARDLSNRELLRQTGALLEKDQLPAKLPCLEITESASWKSLRI